MPSMRLIRGERRCPFDVARRWRKCNEHLTGGYRPPPSRRTPERHDNSITRRVSLPTSLHHWLPRLFSRYLVGPCSGPLRFFCFEQWMRLLIETTVWENKRPFFFFFFFWMPVNHFCGVWYDADSAWDKAPYLTIMSVSAWSVLVMVGLTASALLSLQKGCGLWTLSCDFVHHFLLKH